MTEIKDYIETQYPNNKDKLTDIYVDDKDLEGEFDLREDYPSLERIFISNKSKLLEYYDLNIAEITEKTTELKGFRIKTKGFTKIYYFVPAQDWLDKNYPKNDRKSVTELDLRQKGLRGSLNLNDFTALKKLEINLDCRWYRHGKNTNYITEIKLEKCEELIDLTLTDCPVEMGLDIFEPLTKLEKLNISGSWNYPAKFTGSLESLKDCTDLKSLDISFTNGLTDLEKLPFEKFTDFKFIGTDWQKTLEPYNYDPKAWLFVNHPDIISGEKDKLLKALNEYLEECHKELKELKKTEQINKISRQESKIELLEKKNREILTA